MAKPDTGNQVLAVGERRKFQVGPCNYLYCYDQTGLVEVELWADEKLQEVHTVERLLNLPRKKFDTFYVKNVHSAENTVRFFMGKGDYVPNADRSVVVIDDASPPVVALAPGSTIELTGSTVNVTSDVASVLSPVDDVTVTAAATLLAAAAANRIELTISIKDTEANGVRVGSAAVTATKGIYVGPGQSYTVANRGAIYAIRDGAADVVVSVLGSEKAP